MQSPWDEIAIQYVLTCSHIAKRRSGDAFKEQSHLVSLFYRFFTENRGWTLPALFSILRDLRDLAFDADLHAKYNGQKSECMEEAARIIAKAFGNCMTDRTSPPDQSRKWGIYYIVGLVLKCYFRACISFLHGSGSSTPHLPFPGEAHILVKEHLEGS